MEINRVQIEGGFLDGFDVEFASGLNVLIGARGTGKTSVIELMRFALDARNHTTEAAQRSVEHARAVLDDGEVSVQLSDLISTQTVSRSSNEEAPKSPGPYEKPLIFSQTEIENVGLSEGGRLRLLDSFIPEGGKLASAEAAAIAAIKSVFKEIAALDEERRGLTAGLEKLPELEKKIKELEGQEAQHRVAAAGLDKKQKALAEANAIVTSSTVRESVLERFEKAASVWANELERRAAEDFGPEDWDPADGPDPLEPVRSRYSSAVQKVAKLAGEFEALATQASTERERLGGSRLESEGLARRLRTDVEQSVAGAGAISRQLSQLRTEVAQLGSRLKLVRDRDVRMAQVRERRDERIKELDALRLERFERRSTVAASLTKALGPAIRVSVERYGQYADYNRALTEALRGSGLRYADLVGSLSQSVSPQELIRFVDGNDFVALANISGIPADRAARLLGHLRDIGTADIVTVSIEDNVRMTLLDGVDYKDLEHLSAGQRCTVILSIILQHTTRTLIIDQPEDHLDNAYIATTVIKAIRSRKAGGQLIISTHNANIPVLGGADLVIEMTSDGRNGFVQVCAQLDDSEAVDAITKVMEGGRKAFEERAKFYHEHES